jgi:transcriptional regulator with XRE-family HTH domain
LKAKTMDKIIDYKKLRDSRVDKDLKQKEIAAKLNIEQSTYSKMEKGKIGIRPEQLAIIAEAVGKNIDELLKQEAKTNNNKNSQEVLKAENEFLKSMLKLYSSFIEEEVFDWEYKYAPEHEFTFEQYLKAKGEFGCSPECAVMRIKEDVEEFQKDGGCFLWDGEIVIKNFIGKDDKWLSEFVRKEENYDLVSFFLGNPRYTTSEEYYQTFKNMLKENPLIHNLFRYGLLENYRWNEYLKEMKSTPTGDGSHPSYNPWPVKKQDGGIDLGMSPTVDLITTSRKREEREKIRGKMKSLLPDKY